MDSVLASCHDTESRADVSGAEGGSTSIEQTPQPSLVKREGGNDGGGGGGGICQKSNAETQKTAHCLPSTHRQEYLFKKKKKVEGKGEIDSETE